MIIKLRLTDAEVRSAIEDWLAKTQRALLADNDVAITVDYTDRGPSNIPIVEVTLTPPRRAVGPDPFL